MSDVSVRTHELARFITSPIRSELRTIQNRIDDLGSRVHQSYGTRLRQNTLASEIERRKLEEDSLKEQADALRGSLTDLSDEDRATLDKGKSYDEADAAIEAWLSNISSLQDEAEAMQSSVQSDIDSAPGAPEEPNGDILKSASDEHGKLLRDAVGMLGQLAAKSAAVRTALEDEDADNPWAAWRRASSEFRASYKAAVERSSAQTERIEQLREIESRLSDYSRATRGLQEELRDLQSAEQRYLDERDRWVSALGTFDQALSAECAKLTQNADDIITAEVERFADASDFLGKLRGSLSGSGLRREKIEALANSITEAEDGQVRWTEILTDLEALAIFDPERDGAERRPETPALSGAGLTDSDLVRIAKRLTTDDWLSLSLTQIGSKPVFRYRSREGDYIEFQNASAGQQATALMKALLNQPGPPLIIDQPEEDLDNPVMFEIVEQIWKAKEDRQLIFASHNANLVVNGDAELVTWCDYRKAGDQSLGKIAGEGAIDLPDVREAIKRVMEGGEAAFKLRKEKYGF